MEWNWNETKDWIGSFVLMTIGVFAKLVFGKQKLTTLQLLALWAFCGGIVFLTNNYITSGIIRGSIQLCCGLVAVNLITGIIKGGEKSETKISETIEHNVENIAEKVDNIADAITKNKKDQ